jgi:hypothetical protein
MREIAASEIRALCTDLTMELERLRRLEQDITMVQQEIQNDPDRAALFYQVQALKLHNFYTGCERIFSLVTSELYGAKPSGFDWHKRLLRRMTAQQADAPALLSLETAQQLEEYLGFRHVVRNVYGFELDVDKVKRLIQSYPAVWHRFEQDVQQFVQWLLQLAEQLEAIE